jgi:pimeloyl-ACP methyl ester carboxylesterase
MSLYVHETGLQNAPTIVFLHGLGISSWMWVDQIAGLQRDYHCLAIDLPGNGDSYQSEWHSFTDTAKQIAEVIREKAATGKAHVVGLSLGGYTALHVLSDHADVVESMIISGVTPRPFSNQPAWRLLSKTIMPMLLMTPLGSSLMAKAMQLPEDATALYKKDTKRLNRQTIERIYEEIITFDLSPSLAQRPQRFLAAAGEHDVTMIKNGLVDFLGLLPNAQAVIAPKAHHGWNGEFPQLFTEMIRAWIENQPLPDTLVPITAVPTAQPLAKGMA